MESDNPIEVLDKPEIHRILFYPYKLTAGRGDSRNIFFNVEPDVQICCRFYKADKKFPTIIFFHGNGETSPDYDDIARFFNEIEVNLIVTDYRGYGYSNGSPTIASLLNDAKILFKEIKKMLKDNGFSSTLYIMGRSLGSLCGLEVVKEYQNEIAGLIVESGSATNFRNYLSMFGLVPFDHPVWKEGKTFFNKEKIRLVKIKTLIMHAEFDSIIPLEEAKILYENSAARNKKLIIIPEADHNTIMYMDRRLYFNSLTDFIKNP